MMLLNPYRFGDPIEPFDPLSLYEGVVGGSLLDIQNTGTLWADDAGTVPASVGGTVALISDRTGNGVHACQTNASLRPYLRQDAGGKYYLEGDGARWMYLGTSAAQTDLPDLVAVAAQRATNSSSVLLAKSHASSHQDPYYRWSMWRVSSGVLECRINGTPYGVAGWGAADTVLTIDSPAGKLRTARGSGETSFTPVTLTYPNSVQARLFANSSDGELFVGRLYALALVGRALTTIERAHLEGWAAARMP